jgi:hypothetical protein
MDMNLPSWQLLLVAYAITFGIQNKVTFLRGRFGFLDRMIECTYCIGTHTGWMVWGLQVAFTGKLPFEMWQQNVISFITWAFCGGISSYLLDAAAQWLESRSE